MNFDITVIEQLVMKIIPKDFNYNIHQSGISESIYLTISKDNIQRSVRFSDHPTKDNIKCCYIGTHTKEEKINRTISNLIKYIKDARVKTIIDNLVMEDK